MFSNHHKLMYLVLLVVKGICSTEAKKGYDFNVQSTLVIAARVITANLVNGKKLMGTNLHQC